MIIDETDYVKINEITENEDIAAIIHVNSPGEPLLIQIFISISS